MHELGIADAICKTVTRIVGENGVEHLRSVTVEVGTPCRPRPDARIAAVYL